MNKSTLQIILIVGLVFLGMTLLTKPKNSDGEGDADRTAAAAAPAAAKDYTVIDSIRPAVVERLGAYLQQAGTPDENGAGGYSYSNSNGTLHVDAEGNVSGTVVATPTVTLDYADVVASHFPDTLTIETKSRAAYALRGTVDELREAATEKTRYAGFAHLRANGEAAPVTLANNRIALEITPNGGYIAKATLKDYKTYFPEADDKHKVDTADVVMFHPAADPRLNAYMSFILRTTEQTDINTKDLVFTPRQLNDSTLEMVMELGGGAEWGMRYTLPQDSYIIRMDIVQRNMGAHLGSNLDRISLGWQMGMPREERGRTFEERNSAVYYKYVGDSPDDLNSQKSTTERLNSSVQWVAFKNQFFSTVIIPRKPFDNAIVEQNVYKEGPQSEHYVKRMAADMTVNYNSRNEIASSFDIFIGPNLYNLLKDVDHQVNSADDLDLTRLIPLGWSWLRWINTLIVIPVFSFLSGFISNYGIIILLLTIFIKIILFPFTYKSYMSQAKMRVLAPEIKEINEKYPGKENAMVRQQKTMALYSKAGASPFSGCLPLLLQMPILIAMFSFFPSCIELRGQSFLWAQDLAAPDVILTLPFSIPFYGSHVSLFCLLMTVTNIVYTRINMQNQPSSSSMPGMKWMMYLMPLMFLFFFNDYAAALSYYYFLSLLITIVQTWIFRRCVNEKKLRQRMMEAAAKPRKKSGFMARLEEAQRRQQEMLRQQQSRNSNRRR